MAQAAIQNQTTATPKRGPGRPRKLAVVDGGLAPATKKGPGRPKKTEATATVTKPRNRMPKAKIISKNMVETKALIWNGKIFLSQEGLLEAGLIKAV